MAYERHFLNRSLLVVWRNFNLKLINVWKHNLVLPCNIIVIRQSTLQLLRVCLWRILKRLKPFIYCRSLYVIIPWDLQEATFSWVSERSCRQTVTFKMLTVISLVYWDKVHRMFAKIRELSLEAIKWHVCVAAAMFFPSLRAWQSLKHAQVKMPALMPQLSVHRCVLHHNPKIFYIRHGCTSVALNKVMSLNISCRALTMSNFTQIEQHGLHDTLRGDLIYSLLLFFKAWCIVQYSKTRPLCFGSWLCSCLQDNVRVLLGPIEYLDPGSRVFSFEDRSKASYRNVVALF